MRWPPTLLLPSGVAVGHMLGYGVVRWAGGTPSVSGHSYVDPLLVVAVPLAVWALVWAGLAWVRRAPVDLGFRRLVSQQLFA